MAFVDDLKLTYTTAKIITWSNAGDSTNATAIDTAVIDHFEDMVEGEFRVQAGILMDLTGLDRKIHLGPAMRRAGFLLRRYGGEIGQQSTEDDKSLQMIKDLRPVTNSNELVPSKGLVNDIPIADTDESAFDASTQYRNGFPSLRQSDPVRNDERFT